MSCPQKNKCHAHPQVSGIIRLCNLIQFRDRDLKEEPDAADKVDDGDALGDAPEDNVRALHEARVAHLRGAEDQEDNARRRNAAGRVSREEAQKRRRSG